MTCVHVLTLHVCVCPLCVHVKQVEVKGHLMSLRMRTLRSAETFWRGKENRWGFELTIAGLASKEKRWFYEGDKERDRWSYMYEGGPYGVKQNLNKPDDHMREGKTKTSRRPYKGGSYSAKRKKRDIREGPQHCEARPVVLRETTLHVEYGKRLAIGWQTYQPASD